MAEHVSDLLEAGSLLHHAAGHGVPEDVGTGERRVDGRPAKRTGHDTGDGSARDRFAATRAQVLHEHSALVGRRAFPAQIVDQRLPHDARQRQYGASAVLPGAHLDRAAPPVDVVQAQVGHLAGSESQGRQALHDRMVPLSARAGNVERRQHLLDLLIGQGTRQQSQAASSATAGRAASSSSPQQPSKRRNRKNDRSVDRTVRIELGENRPRNDVMNATTSAGARWAGSTGSVPRASDPDEAGAATQRLRTQPARTSLVLGICLDQTVEGPRAVNGHGMLLSGQSGRTEHPATTPCANDL